MDDLDSSRLPSQNPFSAVYGFPFQLNNLKVWMILTFCMILLAFDASGFAGITKVIISEIPEGQEFFGVSPTILFTIGRYVYPALFIFAVISSVAPSVYLLVIIQDTAAGNDEVDWPKDVWYDFIGKFFLVVWLFGCCAALSTVFWLLVNTALAPLEWEIMPVIWWGLVLLSAGLLFPIPLYSTMISGSAWTLVHPGFIGRVIEKPIAGLAIYVHSLILLPPCVALGIWLIFTLNWWLSPIIGMFWALCVFWYGRALGRVGYVLAEERRRVVRKKKRKKLRPRREPAD